MKENSDVIKEIDRGKKNVANFFFGICIPLLYTFMFSIEYVYAWVYVACTYQADINKQNK